MGRTVVYAEIYGENKPLKVWAEEYSLTYNLLAERYKEGKRGESLIEPYEEDKLTDDDIHKAWNGKWLFKKKNPLQAPVCWREGYRWVWTKRKGI